jgi:elongation factor G
MIKSMLDSTPCVVQLPIGSEENFLGVIDLVRMEAIIWDNEDLGATFQTVRAYPETLKNEMDSLEAKHRASLGFFRSDDIESRL